MFRNSCSHATKTKIIVKQINDIFRLIHMSSVVTRKAESTISLSFECRSLRAVSRWVIKSVFLSGLADNIRKVCEWMGIVCTGRESWKPIQSGLVFLSDAGARLADVSPLRATCLPRSPSGLSFRAWKRVTAAMSYWQAYGHPPVLSNAPATNGICTWTETVGCENSHRPSTYSRLNNASSRETLGNYRPATHRCLSASNNNQCVKRRRATANRKERRRTLSINNAFQELRGCIPQVPADTKLSKIKTLRLASSYIAYLMDLLAKDEAKSPTPFKPQVVTKNEQPTSVSDLRSL